jgi:hypothetical protein
VINSVDFALSARGPVYPNSCRKASVLQRQQSANMSYPQISRAKRRHAGELAFGQVHGKPATGALSDIILSNTVLFAPNEGASRFVEQDP